MNIFLLNLLQGAMLGIFLIIVSPKTIFANLQVPEFKKTVCDVTINKKEINEVQAQTKLESFRRLNKNYLYPSFDTIAGSGKNGAIVHYRAKR